MTYAMYKIALPRDLCSNVNLWGCKKKPATVRKESNPFCDPGSHFCTATIHCEPVFFGRAQCKNHLEVLRSANNDVLHQLCHELVGTIAPNRSVNCYDSVKHAVISKLEKVTSLKFHVDSGYPKVVICSI